MSERRLRKSGKMRNPACDLRRVWPLWERPTSSWRGPRTRPRGRLDPGWDRGSSEEISKAFFFVPAIGEILKMKINFVIIKSNFANEYNLLICFSLRQIWFLCEIWIIFNFNFLIHLVAFLSELLFKIKHSNKKLKRLALKKLFFEWEKYVNLW
jgi:hypothetical protein